MLAESQIGKALGNRNDLGAIQVRLASSELRNADRRQASEIESFIRIIGRFREIPPSDSLAVRFSAVQTPEELADMVALYQLGMSAGRESTDRIWYEIEGKQWKLASDCNSVDVKDLTPEELLATRIPDDSVNCIWANFTSPASRRYTAVHVFEHSAGPYILLSNKDRDRKDFKAVESTVAQITRGKPEGRIMDREIDICDVIKLGKLPTQATVAGFVEEYSHYFNEVLIPIAHYNLFRVFTGERCNVIRKPTSLARILPGLVEYAG